MKAANDFKNRKTLRQPSIEVSASIAARLAATICIVCLPSVLFDVLLIRVVEEAQALAFKRQKTAVIDDS